MSKWLLYLVALSVMLTGCSLDVLFDDLSYEPIAASIEPTIAPNISLTPILSPNPDCYAPMFFPDRGIQVGTQAVVQPPGAGAFSDLSVSAEFYFEHGTSSPAEFLPWGETVTVISGPYCYYTRNSQTRWWHVRVNSSGLEGYMDEYSTYVGILQVYLDPAVTATDSNQAEIRHFSVSIGSPFGRPANQGEQVFISWDVGYAADVSVIRVDTNEVVGSGLHGSMPFDLPLINQPSMDFMLVATGLDGQPVQEVRTLQINCLDCQSSATDNILEPVGTSLSMSYQLFESGLMLYRTDTSQVYVLYNNGTVQTFADTWQGETYSEDVPAGYVVPQFGFGAIWSTQTGVRDALGWATAQEVYTDAQVLTSGAYQLDVPISGSQHILIGNGTWQYQND